MKIEENALLRRCLKGNYSSGTVQCIRSVYEKLHEKKIKIWRKMQIHKCPCSYSTAKYPKCDKFIYFIGGRREPCTNENEDVPVDTFLKNITCVKCICKRNGIGNVKLNFGVRGTIQNYYLFLYCYDNINLLNDPLIKL
uniref:CSON007969 protein n=1 Tax=Culicoides sonorensis TaxID=179676 RepID=A0A336N0F0_CULSO